MAESDVPALRDAEFDAQARRMGEIMGAALDRQIVNSQYRVDRGNKPATDQGHLLLLRARQLRDDANRGGTP